MSPHRPRRPAGPPAPRRAPGTTGPPRGPAPPSGHPSVGEAEEPPLLADVRGLLAEPVPWPLTELVSSLIAALHGPAPDPFARTAPAAEGGTDLAGLVRSFLELDTRESTALLTVIAELVPDELMTRRIVRVLGAREHALPTWLEPLGPPEVVRVLELSHVLGDGDNIALGVRAGSGDEGTLVLYVDHNLGTLVKDAFVVDNPLATVADRFLEATHEDHDLAIAELEPADARARLVEAVEAATGAYPPYETDSWPACRPLLEWVLRHLPHGGEGYPRPEWTQEERDGLIEQFLASPHGRDHDHEQGLELLDALVWFGCDEGRGNPLRWSPVSVELLLTDWLPRKVLLPPARLLGAPELLVDFVRFGHERLGLRSQLTDRAEHAVRQCTPEFEELVRRDDASAAATALARIVGGEVDARWDVPFDDDLLPVGYREMMLALLREAVGGDDELRGLDTGPLPDEDLDTAALPADVRDRVAEVAGLTDRCCADLLDHEHRTACRRVLADVAAADPRIFRRRGRSETAAAAVVWIVARANRSFDSHAPGGFSARGLSAWFGIAGRPSARASTFLAALEVGKERRHGSDLRLGTPRYLVARRRDAILDHWRRLTRSGA